MGSIINPSVKLQNGRLLIGTLGPEGKYEYGIRRSENKFFGLHSHINAYKGRGLPPKGSGRESSRVKLSELCK
jgi:hypothetical protein